jgi:hypothetical protein
MDTQSPESETESASLVRPQSEIEALARETRTDTELVKELYEHEVAQLQSTAKIRPYISVIAWRHVSMVLRKEAAERGVTH